MTDVWSLAESRAELPTFAGSTVAEQLYNGRNEALARLGKYVGNLTYDESQSEAVLHEVETWVQRDNDEIKKALADPTSAHLPEQISFELGVQKARQFVVASYSVAARTLGPWVSGMVYEKIQSGELSQLKAEEDARARLSIFASIVKWDDDGDLATIFSPQAGTSGLALGRAGLSGMPVIVVAGIAVAILVSLVVAAAVIINMTNANEVVRRNAALFEAMCKEAQDKGDSATAQRCLELSAGLQREAIEQGNVAGTIAKWVVIAGGAYMLGRYIVIPMIKKRGHL